MGETHASSPLGECDEGLGEEGAGGTPVGRCESAVGPAEHTLVAKATTPVAMAEPAPTTAGRRCQNAREEVRVDPAPGGAGRRG
jgi:hypothetical protein